MKGNSYICEIDDLVDPGSFGFDIYHNDEEVKGFVVKRNGKLFA